MPAALAKPRRLAAWPVLALHLLAGLWLWWLPPWADRDRAQALQPSLVWVQLPTRAPGSPQPEPARRRPEGVWPGRPKPRTDPPAAPASPAAITLSPPGAPSSATSAAQAAAAPDAPAAPHDDAAAAHLGSAPLNLSLPRGAWREFSPAAMAGSARTPAFEARIAAALGGTDGLVEERLDADRMRVRRGTQCIELRRSRAGVLDPGGPFRELWQGRAC